MYLGPSCIHLFSFQFSRLDPDRNTPLQLLTAMVELRKRKEAPAAQPPPAAKKSNSVRSSSSAKANGSSATSGGKVAVGDVINLDDFGGEIETNDGEKTTLKELVDDSKAGVVLFTYPKASTPGCELHHAMIILSCKKHCNIYWN